MIECPLWYINIDWLSKDASGAGAHHKLLWKLFPLTSPLTNWWASTVNNVHTTSFVIIFRHVWNTEDIYWGWGPGVRPTTQILALEDLFKLSAVHHSQFSAIQLQLHVDRNVASSFSLGKMHRTNQWTNSTSAEIGFSSFYSFTRPKFLVIIILLVKISDLYWSSGHLRRWIVSPYLK